LFSSIFCQPLFLFNETLFLAAAFAAKNKLSRINAGKALKLFQYLSINQQNFLQPPNHQHQTPRRRASSAKQT
jgi:hypothetical protein